MAQQINAITHAAQQQQLPVEQSENCPRHPAFLKLESHGADKAPEEDIACHITKTFYMVDASKFLILFYYYKYDTMVQFSHNRIIF